MIEVRNLELKDLGDLAKLYVDVYDKFDVGEHWDKESAERLLGYWLERQPDLSFVAHDGDKLIGAFVAGIKPWWDGNHLVDGEIFVHPDYQGQGVGSLLSEKMFQSAIEGYGATVWDTYTFRKPEFPRGWYESLGFGEIEDWMMISGDINEALKQLRSKNAKR